MLREGTSSRLAQGKGRLLSVHGRWLTPWFPWRWWWFVPHQGFVVGMTRLVADVEHRVNLTILVRVIQSPLVPRGDKFPAPLSFVRVLRMYVGGVGRRALEAECFLLEAI